jgi:tRNA threonylcarbamoyladenosine biosynthesis protein TsaB
MIDARRMEVYNAFYDINNNKTVEIAATIIDDESFKDILDERTVYFFGNGSEKCKETIKHPNAIFIDNISNSALNMITLAHKAFNNQSFEDVAYFEPFYLKDFVATTPKKKMF